MVGSGRGTRSPNGRETDTFWSAEPVWAYTLQVPPKHAARFEQSCLPGSGLSELVGRPGSPNQCRLITGLRSRWGGGGNREVALRSVAYFQGSMD